MAVQIPEPDYYPLAEVAKRWGVSEDVLLRLGAEYKVLMGYPLALKVAYAVRSTQKAGCVGWERLSAEMLHAIDIDPDLIGGAEAIGEDNIVHFPVGGVAECDYEIKIALATGRDSFSLHNLRGFTLYRASDGVPAPAPTLPDDHHYNLLGKTLNLSFTDLVIPTDEIHRIEGQHEAAEDAAADDVLGGSAIASRRLMLTVINALCGKAGINPRARNATTEIMRLLDGQGTPAAERTIRDAIKEIPRAMKTRKTEQ